MNEVQNPVWISGDEVPDVMKMADLGALQSEHGRARPEWGLAGMAEAGEQHLRVLVAAVAALGSITGERPRARSRRYWCK